MLARPEREGRPLAEMEAIADQFVELIKDSVDRVQICGSIRRRRPMPKDIDIVAIPKISAVAAPTAFGFTIRAMENFLHSKIDRMISEDLLKPRVKSDGTTMIGNAVAFVTFQGVALDVYYASEQTFSGLVLMRTGSANHNTMLATLALKQGKKFHADGLGVTQDGKRLDDGQSEESIFRALEMPNIPPEQRD
jgi:DNA polymerase/3'-5' exonuclease PolX